MSEEIDRLLKEMEPPVAVFVLPGLVIGNYVAADTLPGGIAALYLAAKVAKHANRTVARAARNRVRKMLTIVVAMSSLPVLGLVAMSWLSTGSKLGGAQRSIVLRVAVMAVLLAANLALKAQLQPCL
ncbi:hypothetical protein WJX72_008650 [[Myrmecia] bisecta]|uniref:Uncharacterized protein n=1 Tax=[Myrmecia] bisecta TaxID=41462 RepID=A0AAW1R7X5_9CHLO